MSSNEETSRTTPSVRLTELLSLVPVQMVSGDREQWVRGVTLDSREIEEGFIFIAIRGERMDGHRFIEDAVARGAVCVVSEYAPSEIGRLVDPGESPTWVQTPDARKAAGVMAARVLGEPSSRIELVGITGTNGKTTTAFLVQGLLSRLAPPAAMMGTVVATLGKQSWPTRHTTPEAPTVQSFLADAVEKGCRFGVLEVSSHGLSLSRMEGTRLKVGVFTNLSRDHLDFHHDMEDYFQSKRLLFTRYLAAQGRAVVCIDDAYGERLAADLDVPVVTYGSSPTADLSLEEVSADLSGVEMRFREGQRSRRLKSPLLGRYNALNLLGAYAAACALGFEADQVLDALAVVSGAPGRFEKVDVDRPFDVVVDYAHTDDALRKLLEAARPLTRGRLWVIFGCGGERDRTKRPLMGDVATRLADRVILTSDNPRGENPESILNEIELGAKGGGVSREVDRRRAIEMALTQASAGDLVVIAGKGHEPYQIVGDEVLAFDDREVVRELLSDTSEPVAPTKEGDS